ncbi:MAG: adenylate/guanylate cyclase domain-containing protein, partial [Acidimicrobiales bacterium]
VKMIGDEAMFVVDEAVHAARIGLTLSEAYADDELLSDVRVGIAFGPVLLREGDYFGRVVNLASRLVNLGKPGTVLTSEEVHSVLEGDAEFSWRRLRGRSIKDIGPVDVWVLRRPQADGDGGVPRAQRRNDLRWSRRR